MTATTTSPAKLGLLEQLGAEAVVMDGLDALSVGEAVAKARPDAIVHQMTAIAGKPDMKHMDRWFATTNRLRTEGTDHLLAAAEATGVSHFVAQSYACWNGIRKGGWVKTEETSSPVAVPGGSGEAWVGPNGCGQGPGGVGKAALAAGGQGGGSGRGCWPRWRRSWRRIG